LPASFKHIDSEKNARSKYITFKISYWTTLFRVINQKNNAELLPEASTQFDPP